MMDEEYEIDRDEEYEIVPFGLAPHPTGINSIATTGNFKWLFTASDDGFIRKYDLETTINSESSLTAIQRHGYVDSIQKGGALVSAWENSYSMVNATGVEEKRVSSTLALDAHSEGVWCVAGLDNGHVNLYTVRHDEGSMVHAFAGHSSNVSCLKITPSERQLISGSWDKTMALWDLDTGARIRLYDGFATQLNHISPMPGSNDLFLVTCIDGSIRIYDVRVPIAAKLFLPAMSKSPPWAFSASWGVSGKRLFCGRRNGTVDEYDVGANALVQSIKMPPNSGPVSFVKNQSSASFDNIRLWDTLAEDPKETKSGTSIDFNDNVSTPFVIVAGHHGGVISNLAFNSTQDYLISTSGLRGWDGTATNAALFYQVIHR